MDNTQTPPKFDASMMQDLEIWVESRFNAEFLALANMKKEMEAHRNMLAQNSAENQELILLLRKVKVIISILSGVEKIAVWVSKVAIMMGLIWATWKFVIVETLKQVRTGG